jgi:tetratricopeptide (TPR) repeat protein
LLKVIKLEDPKGGLADYNSAAKIDPNNAFNMYLRGITKTDILHDTAGGMADLDRAAKLEPNDPIVYDVRGSRKYDLLKDRTGAIADLKQANKLYKQQGNIQAAENIDKVLKEWQQTDRKSDS